MSQLKKLVEQAEQSIRLGYVSKAPFIEVKMQRQTDKQRKHEQTMISTQGR